MPHAGVRAVLVLDPKYAGSGGRPLLGTRLPEGDRGINRTEFVGLDPNALTQDQEVFIVPYGENNYVLASRAQAELFALRLHGVPSQVDAEGRGPGLAGMTAAAEAIRATLPAPSAASGPTGLQEPGDPSAHTPRLPSFLGDALVPFEAANARTAAGQAARGGGALLLVGLGVLVLVILVRR